MGILDFLVELHGEQAFKYKHGRRPTAKEWKKMGGRTKYYKKQHGGYKRKHKKRQIKKIKPKKDSLYSESVIINGVKYSRPT